MNQMQVLFVRRRGWCVAACAALAWGGALGSDAAFGQLRTGRNGSREFYSDPRSNSPARRIGTGIQDDEGVVQAGCRSCVQGHEGEVVADHVGHSDESATVVDGDIDRDIDGTTGTCGACGSDDGACGCDGIPHINIRLALPFINAFDNLSFRMEAATFWRDDAAIPALVRTGTTATARDLFGGTTGLDDTTQGYRGEVAWRFGKDVCTSVQVRFFDAGAQSLTFDSVGTNATIPAIVRPYLNIPGSTQQSISVREPGVSSGDVLGHATSDLFGGDILLRQIAYRTRHSKLDLLLGYQTASLSDSISVNSLTNTPPSPNQTQILELRDRFDTNSRFHGGVIGFSGIAYAPRWSVSSMVKLGMGNMERYVGIEGFQRITAGVPPVSTSTAQGLHARATNMGTYHFDTFVVSPEVNLTLGYRLTRRLEATFGYDYLLLPKVARAAEQFDPELGANLSNPLTGDPRPRFTFRESDLGIHSLNYGLQYRY